MDTIAAFWAGETKVGNVSYTDYPASTHSLQFRFADRLKPFNITATDSGGDSFICTIPAATSATIDPGDLHYVAFATHDTSGVVTAVESGTMRVSPNLQLESSAQRTLAAITALIEGRATDDQLTTEIADVQLANMSAADLLRWQTYFSVQVTAEANAIHAAIGYGRRGKVVTRFTR